MTKNAQAESGNAERNLDALREAMLDAALPDVVFDGWSEALFRRAARETGISRETARIAFPAGAFDMAALFHRRGDREMRERLDKMQVADMRIREKISSAVRIRLEIAEPHREAVRRATAMYALPPHAPQGARLMWETADAIWAAAGDSSTDYNWYTKRLTLSGVISSTLLFWLEDTSPESEATWRFLDRRIENVMQFEKLKAQVKKNPLAQFALAGPRALLNRVQAPEPNERPGNLPVGFPGR